MQFSSPPPGQTWYFRITPQQESGFNDEIVDSFHDKLKVAESLDQMDLIVRKHGGNLAMATTSLFPKGKTGNMFQIPGNRCHFNSFNKDMTFWVACFLPPPNLAWPTGIAFSSLASYHTALIELAACITHPKFKFGQQSRGWVALRQDEQKPHSKNTSQLKQTQPKIFLSSRQYPAEASSPFFSKEALFKTHWMLPAHHQTADRQS